MKYYKDTAGNVYAYSYIQTPKEGLVPLTETEAEAHLNPQPTPEQLAYTARAKRDTALVLLDTLVSNPLRYSELSAEQKEEAKVYRQALLDVPQQGSFPRTYTMPEIPSWLS